MDGAVSGPLFKGFFESLALRHILKMNPCYAGFFMSKKT